ncbi:c-type cytochrome biogenesis protein CcmI [Phyllobacterium salinisoli]|uniref:C-type cytochrome biogenesis protein CcmI n=1 Tax=Phyllobacterium salinisoli TaxID=1899321 RepID=A0A368K582_9HYPH|nr:c-type cytochrome biogenesis protein CcmI [Phyllobacterium salinisoli]RCS23532.1 c-type cytochrome biogenesis protein CcmI [Phyllobacterium salinisoli]
MEFWLIAVLLTFAATLAVLLPLTRRKTADAADGQYDLEVYRDQMREVDADAARGLIDPQSAEQARAEIGRRMLKAEHEAKQQDNTKIPGMQGARWVVLSAVLSVPLISWSLYALTGSPDVPAQPLAERMAKNPADGSVNELIARAEAHLAQNPDDGQGWDVLAPVYLRLQRPQDAVNAYRNAIRLQGESAERTLGLGEALALVAGGTITGDAQAMFERAAALDPNDIRPRFMIARGLMQEGRNGDAADLLQNFLDKAPADAPWRDQLKTAIERIRNPAVAAANGPDQEDVEAAANMNPEDRNAMINSMVATLDERLKQNPDDVEGWKRLVRSYLILNRRDDALAALKRGNDALAGEKRNDLVAFAKGLGLELAEVKP